MANVLEDLAADIYRAADIVGREAVGLIPSVTINAGSEQAAQGDPVRSHFTRQPTVNNTATPSMTPPEGDDQTVDTKTMTLTQIGRVSIPWTGEDMKHVRNGAGYETIYGDQIEQAFRGITNQIEAYLGVAAKNGASRAIGTAGTTPFASDFNLIPELRQVLFDNGMPVNDGRLSLVMNSLAGTNLRKHAQLQKANESGGTQLLRQGTLLDLMGFMLKESAGIASHVKGTGSGYLVNDAGGLAIGDTDVAVDTGTGTILAGDVVTYAADTVNKYVVNTALTGDTFVMGTPGARAAIPDSNAITVGNNYTGNIALHQSAMELAIRPLAKPDGGDMATDEMIIQDVFSGLTFRISAYKGYYKSMFDIVTLYGAKVWKPDAVAILLG